MEIKPIRTEEDYRNYLEEIHSLFDANPGSPEGERLDVLVTLVEGYEANHYPVSLPDPISAIEFHMERLGLTRKDLESYIGGPSRVSEILNHKRPLNLRMIRNLHKGLGISLEVLFQEYPVESAEEPDDNSFFFSFVTGLQLFELSGAGSADKTYPKPARKSGDVLEIRRIGKPNLTPSSSTSFPPSFSILNAYSTTESERITQ